LNIHDELFASLEPALRFPGYPKQYSYSLIIRWQDCF
jgi:hypothetical protein